MWRTIIYKANQGEKHCSASVTDVGDLVFTMASRMDCSRAQMRFDVFGIEIQILNDTPDQAALAADYYNLWVALKGRIGECMYHKTCTGHTQ